MSGYKDDGRVVDVIHFEFRKALGTVACSIVIWKLRTYGLDARWFDGLKFGRAVGLKER